MLSEAMYLVTSVIGHIGYHKLGKAIWKYSILYFFISDVGSYLKLVGQLVEWRVKSAPSRLDRVN